MATKKDICILLSTKVMEVEQALSDVSEHKEKTENPWKRKHTEAGFQKKVYADDKESVPVLQKRCHQRQKGRNIQKRDYQGERE